MRLATRLEIHKDCDLRLPRQALSDLARLIGRAEKQPARTAINLIVTNSRRLRILNRDYRRLDRTTDVLSFSFVSAYGTVKSSDLIGEVYVSAQHIRVQAKEIGHSESAETLRLTCHGLLHILGYDHKTREQEQKMQRCEKKYLKALKRKSPRSPNTIV